MPRSDVQVPSAQNIAILEHTAKRECSPRREAPRSFKLFPSCRGPIQTEASYVQSQMGKRSVPACSKGQAVTAFG